MGLSKALKTIAATLVLPSLGHSHPHGPTPSACQLLALAFPQSLDYPNSTAYAQQNVDRENWSETCVSTPTCLFQPTSAQQLAAGLLVLEGTDTQFAVRGGGHMPVPGAANITTGVLISTAALNTITLSADKSTAQIGPGLRWDSVYSYLAPYNLTVAGGRYGDVGVGGLLLGGGINYFGSQVGWSMNQVINYQVALANGSIIYATATTNSDLFWALKGGSSNFGIVTRFDMSTISVSTVYGGLAEYTPQALDQYVNAIATYMSSVGGMQDPQTAIDATVGIVPSTGELSLFNILFHRGSDPAPASLSNFTSLPTELTDVSLRTYGSFAADGANPAFNDKTQRHLLWSVGLKATPATVYLANSTFFAATPSMSDIAGLTLYTVYQPITVAWITAARAAGGDAFDLDPANGPLLSFELSAAWSTPDDDARIIEFFDTLATQIKTQAAAVGLAYPFTYINDAYSTQPVFPLYGAGQSLPKLQATAKKYDPRGVFQTLMPGGFKLSGPTPGV